MNIKDGMHVVGIDDAPHERGNPTTEIFFIFCSGLYLEKVDHCTIQVDGFNSTEAVINTLEPVRDQFQLIATHGITTGGFNILDIEKISTTLNVPIISVTENQPKGNFLEAIKNLPEYEKRKSIVEKAGTLNSFITPIGKKPIWYYTKGIDEKPAKLFLKKFAKRSRLPEQILLAHKIATGWKVI